MWHSRFLWALQAKAASGAGSVHALAGYRAQVPLEELPLLLACHDGMLLLCMQAQEEPERQQ